MVMIYRWWLCWCHEDEDDVDSVELMSMVVMSVMILMIVIIIDMVIWYDHYFHLFQLLVITRHIQYTILIYANHYHHLCMSAIIMIVILNIYYDLNLLIISYLFIIILIGWIHCSHLCQWVWLPWYSTYSTEVRSRCERTD